MGVSTHYSPPRAQYQRSPQQQQQQQAGGSPHGLISAPGRYASRSGAASPHPLSFDQTANELSPSRTNTGSPNSPRGERGVKRPAPDAGFGMADNRGMAEDDDELTDDDDDDEDPSGNGYHRHASNGDGSRQDLGSLTPGRAGVPTADKPYACDQCELTFSRQHNLKSHALTHSTERPFSCNVCHTPFRRQHDLKRHMKLHTGEKPYKCTNCERSFARLDALNRHMRAENFHACNQAAKKARTSVMVLDRASRLKSGSSASASVAYLEQRRASTTTTAAHHQYPPPGSSPSVSGGGGLTSVAGAHAPSSWSHWTHRPSIAADEAMLRRMHERFGAPPSYAPVQPQKPPYFAQAASAHKHQSSSAAHAHHHSAASAPYGSSGDPRAYGPSQQPHSQHYASGIHQQQQQQQPPASAPLITSPGTSGSGGTFAAATSQQHQLQTGSRYRGEDAGNTAAHSGAPPLSAISYPVSKTGAHPPLLEEDGSKTSVTVNKSSISQQYRQPSYQPLAAPHQQQQPPPLAVNHQSHPPPHPAQMRLPPIELVAPRRHSLAVTSHLERYRARGGDGATPPQPSREKSTGDSSNDGQQQQQQPGEAAANASAGGGDDNLQPPPYQQHVQKGMYAENESPFGRRGPTQKPPASFLNYTPAVSRQAVNGASLLSAPSSNGMAIGNSTGVKSAADGGPSSVHALPTSRQPGYYRPGQQQQHSAPLLAATNGLAPVSNGEAPANTMAGGGECNRRESSTYSASVERIADTRRSSIIALTNPQSEDDLRTENADLKRRIDEMETRYLKEVDRLNQVVHELEIEKSLLKTLLIEKSDEAVSPLKQQNKAAISSPLSSPKQQGGGSTTTTTMGLSPPQSYSRRVFSSAGIRRQQSMSEQPLVQSVGPVEEKSHGPSGSL
ncbi:hypothetical protein GGI23_004513 [Coemansia sp. RSA 2559]|nr:hypothetical protein GGI23_004513 [Coemansia sp. RSA 2559]